MLSYKEKIRVWLSLPLSELKNTPLLNEIELMDKLEKEKNKIENRIKALYAIRDKCSELVKHLINNVFIEKLYYMNEYSDMLDIHQTTLNRRLNKELTKIINNA